MKDPRQPPLLGLGGRKKVSCVCRHCGNLFRGYSRWTQWGYQPCPQCRLSGTSIVLVMCQGQLRSLLIPAQKEA